jgi:hypothetical protein
MARTRKRTNKTQKKQTIPKPSRSELIERGIKAILEMRSKNSNQMPPDFLQNVENMIKRRKLNKDEPSNEHDIPIFYDAVNSLPQNNGFIQVSRIKRQNKKTRKRVSSKRNENSPQKKQPSFSRSAANESVEYIKTIDLPTSYERKIRDHQHLSSGEKQLDVSSFSRMLKSTSVPHYNSFWRHFANEREFVGLKKVIQTIINHDIEKYSSKRSHNATPWLSGNIAKKVFGSQFHLELKNKPENIVDFKTGQTIGMTQDLPYDYNVSQIIISILSLLVAWINQIMYEARSCDFVIMTKGGRVIQYFGHDYDSFDLDLLIVPKSMLKKTNTNSILQDHNIDSSRILAHEILILLRWFCEIEDKVELSIMTPDHEKAKNKSIFKLSYIKSQRERLGKIRPLIDLGFTWISDNGNNHTNTLPFFTDPVIDQYNLSLLSNMNMKLLCIHQNKQQYQKEKAFILEREFKKSDSNKEERTIAKMRKQLKMLS